MKLLKYLATPGNSPESLKRDLFIGYRKHELYPNLVLFKYSQIDSPMHDSIVQECRGVVIDTNTNTVVSRSYDKFFNIEESLATKIDWSSAKVQEKLDGSLCVLYHYNGKWNVQTSGSPDASGPVDDTNMKFCDLFWDTFMTLGYKLPEFGNDMCIAMELMTPYNKVVVRQTSNRLVMTGARDRISGQQFLAEEAKNLLHLNYETVKHYSFNSPEEIEVSYSSFSPFNQEGYVVVDKYFNRVKCKHPGYIRAHHLRGEGTPTIKRMLAIIKANESDELLAAFPEYKPRHDYVIGGLDKLICDLESYYIKASKHVTDLAQTIEMNKQREAKEFASIATKSKWPDILFKLRAGKIISIRAGLWDAHDLSLTAAVKDILEC